MYFEVQENMSNCKICFKMQNVIIKYVLGKHIFFKNENWVAKAKHKMYKIIL